MPIFYRWISCPENASITKSNHGLTMINVSAENAEELRGIGRIAGEEFPIEPNALIIPLEVYVNTPADDSGITLEVIPELDGVCCFNSESREIEAIIGYGASGENFMMIFEGEEIGSVWDGDLAIVENILEVISCDEFCARFETA